MQLCLYLVQTLSCAAFWVSFFLMQARVLALDSSALLCKIGSALAGLVLLSMMSTRGSCDQGEVVHSAHLQCLPCSTAVFTGNMRKCGRRTR